VNSAAEAVHGAYDKAKASVETVAAKVKSAALVTRS